ncbi:MAG: SpoIID/LytB domain-containing protein, partial [Clostridia bacterium]
KTMDLEDYVKGVMYAELPQDMPPEYYKAMAVAVRTYAVYHAANGDKRSSHLDCDLCCDISHCRAFDYNKTTEAINSAVKITRGELILYNKNPINAVFHISSSVRTESAFEVFGKDIPYLVSVDSKNEETVNGFYGKKELSSNEFLAIMAQNGYILNGKFNDWITYISYTAGGRIKNISVCGYNISGVDFAKMFGLQSANISVKTGSGGFVLETEG